MYAGRRAVGSTAQSMVRVRGCQYSPTTGPRSQLKRVAIFTVIRLPQPSFGSPNRHSGSPSRHSGSPNRHSGASRNLHAAMDSGFPVIPIFPSFRRKPESTRRDRLRFSRHSDFPVIPAQAGIYALRWTPVFPSFRIPPTVIPAFAGIYALRWTPVFAGMTDPHLN